MNRLLRKLRSISSLFRPKFSNPDEEIGEKWTADFSKPDTVRFDIKSESSYDANLYKSGSCDCLALCLKKDACIAWVDAPDFSYRDFVMEGKLRINSPGAYSAAGMMFRMIDDDTYYSFLISSKGFFRLDVVRNRMPFPLIGWTELPGQNSVTAGEIAFTIIAYGSSFIFLINNCWAADINESSIPAGYVSFTAACYEAEGNLSPYYAEAFLEALTIDSRISQAAAMYEKWKDNCSIDPQSRFRLAETFAAMNQPNAAMVQLKKSWEKDGRTKTQKELLLAGRLAMSLELNAEAETYLNACLEANADSPEAKEAVSEMANILFNGERFLELRNFCMDALRLNPGNPIVFDFLGHAHWNLNKYEEAAIAYDRAFELDNENGLFAKNAANAHEALGRNEAALSRYLAACRIFLAEENYLELGILVPKILMLGKEDAQAHALAGKWAFGVEDWETAKKEIKKARSLQKKNNVPPDPALAYLEALLLIQDGKRKQAMPHLKEAVSINNDYALFHFRLAENRFLLYDDPDDAELNAELQAALALDPEDGWINNFAAQINLEKGNLDLASEYIDKAAAILGDLPVIRMNRAALLSRQGFVDEALKILVSDNDDDEIDNGLFTNYAANILFDAKRFEQADAHYRKAIAAEPDNVEYLSNHAACLIELGYFGEADTLLTKIFNLDPSPSVLEQISYVAHKKGEYDRAESACRSALEMEPDHAPSLLSLGWTLVNLGRIAELDEILATLDTLELPENSKRSRDELAKRYDEFTNEIISCASCTRSWKVPKAAEPSPGIRLMDMPPDYLPAGTCPVCGKTWCIGCAKTNLDSSDRFICVECGKPLRLINEGLKKLINDWASKSGLNNNQSSAINNEQ